MSEKVKITVARGDGIGPEIMEATLKILDKAGANLELEEIYIGEKLYLGGNTSGISHESWDILRKNKIFLKAPITTPQGGGYKSLNVTIRKMLGLYANVRPCISYSPFIETKHPNMDVVIIRENEEDLYGGIEHRQTDDVYQCLKLITRPGTEKIIHYAFEYARKYNRKKVSCFTKDNIMKMTDGLFHKVFDEIGKEYPEIEKEHMIIDIGTASLADTPGRFDVIVLPNLYGDIVSDVAAQITGSVGLGPSKNSGSNFAMFEAIHGSAPNIAGMGIANPSGLLLSAVMMLVYIGQNDIAEKIHNAWLKTIEDGIHTADIYTENLSKKKVGTAEFTDAVIERLGQLPQTIAKVSYQVENHTINHNFGTETKRAVKELVGTDVFLQWNEKNANILADSLNTIQGNLKLKMITNRGAKVWPDGLPETFCVDHWRCRFIPKTDDIKVTHQDIIDLLSSVSRLGLDFVKTENLYTFDGEKGYTLGQGE